MATFIDKCNCRGRRPEKIIGTHHNLRPDITGRLLQERNVPRFIVAPTGYGKSSIAFEYAQIVFGFEHVFWVKCTSPCFLRDLDNGTLVEQIIASDSEASLVVCDDVVQLNADRTSAFDSAIDELLQAGIEIIVACTPSVDTFTFSRSSKVMLRATDLLLTDDELSIENFRGNTTYNSVASVSMAERAACLVWNVHGVEMLMQGLKREILPAEMRLEALLALVFTRGAFADLECALSPARIEGDIAFLKDNYPFLGIDYRSRSFESINVDMSIIARCLGMPMQELAINSKAEGPAELSASIAEHLIELGQEARAASFMKHSVERSVCAGWLSHIGWRLLASGEALATDELCEYVRKYADRYSDAISTLCAWSSFMLDDSEKAYRLSQRVIRSASAEWQHKVPCLMLMACKLDNGDDAQLADYEKRLEQVLRLKQMQLASGLDHAILEPETFDWDCALDLMKAAIKGSVEFAAQWKTHELQADNHDLPDASGLRDLHDANGVRNVGVGNAAELQRNPARKQEQCRLRAISNTLMLMGAWYVRCVVERNIPFKKEDGSNLEDMIVYMHEHLLPSIDVQAPRWLRMIAVQAIENCAGILPSSLNVAVPEAALSDARRMELLIIEQIKAHKRALDDRAVAREHYRNTHPDPFRRQTPGATLTHTTNDSTPMLNISLFGGLDVRIDDGTARPCSFRRKKAMIALAMLASNHGKEVSRERIANTLWPDSEADFCKRNFYVVWGYLRRELSINGSCPYLLRSQTGYRLDTRYVVTDVDGFEGLCRSLLFGGDDAMSWEELFECITRDYAEEFLPEITDNSYVKTLRERYNDQLVDGLICASGRLARLGETRGSLWFAREALRRNELREDSYIALMEAQISSNQRGAALETYFTCRRILTERLGIDPSSRVMELYSSIIESEEPF